MFGFLVLNKPHGISSRAALNSITRICKPAKVGHAGTLDPLATGVLVVGVGPATRLIDYVQQSQKFYTGQFRLGFESETEDIESDLVPVVGARVVTPAELESVLPKYLGRIEQLPPQYSALKVDGKRAYKLARRGADFALKPRSIEIQQLKLNRFDFPDFELQIACGSGTYVRSLGRDIGRAVGSGAVMTGLQRTAIGQFSIADAIDPNSLPTKTEMAAVLLPPTRAVSHLETITLSENQVASLRNAVPILISDDIREKDFSALELVGVNADGQLIAILQPQPDGTYSPKINFANYIPPPDTR